jgi:hypothetical protein
MRVQGRRARRSTAVLGALGLVAAVAAGLPAAARAAAPERVGVLGSPSADSQPVPPDGSDLARLPAGTTFRLSPQLAGMLGVSTLDAAGLRALRAAARPGLPGERTPPVGTTLLWPALDTTDKAGPLGIYLKQYTLRAVGKKIEVWVASGSDSVSTGTAFPAGDCRNNVPRSTEVTDTQVKYLIGQFDDNIYPKETKAFSVPPDRTGTNTVPGLVAAGLDFAGDGDHTVTLVDNVRDDNFYDFPKNKSYIAGFYAPIFNQLTDRNVMTIDAFDWVHRTGANPANEPNTDLCKSRPARPFTYESVFGHEWQHLLHQYQDPNETTWVNEGLSMFAESLDGYTDTRLSVHQRGAQSDIFCFHGFGNIKGPANPNPTPCGGPQNSLTMWGDEGPGSEILTDYGNAWSFMLFLYDRYGLAFMSALHRDGPAQGLASVQAQLDKFAPHTKVEDVLHDFQLMNLVDTYLDVPAGTVTGIAKNRVTTKSLDATVNLANPTAYAKPGASPNGADYVRLRNATTTLTGAQLRALTFTGDRTVIPAPSTPGDVSLPDLGGTGNGSAAAGAVADWHVSLVGIDRAHHRVLIKSADGFSLAWGARELAEFKKFPLVVAVIGHDDPNDLDSTTEQYAGYTLKVNGFTQPGG